MGFVGVCRALYDYTPQAAGELAIAENDLLYILDKSEDDGWWKAKKKAGADDDDEPEGLIPNNYVEEVRDPRAFVSTILTARFRILTTGLLGTKSWPSPCSLRIYSAD